MQRTRLTFYNKPWSTIGPPETSSASSQTSNASAPMAIAAPNNKRKERRTRRLIGERRMRVGECRTDLVVVVVLVCAPAAPVVITGHLLHQR